MKLGIPVFLDETLEDTAEFCKDNGLDFIELNANFPQYQAKSLDIDALSEIAEKNGISYTMHLYDTFSPCDFHDGIARAYTETVLEAIEVAKRIHIPILNIHLSAGEFVTLPSGKVYLFERYQNEYIEKLIKFRKTCETAIGTSDIKICVENYGASYSSNIMQKSLEILTESPIFGLTFDIGHNAIANFADEPHIMNYVSKGKLRHFHVHDAAGNKDHLPLGEGELDIEKYLKLANDNDCSVLLEVKTIDGVKKSLKWLKERMI